jgi:hypothetical protein
MASIVPGERGSDGICSMRAIIDSTSVQGPYDATRNPHSWTQCPAPQTMGLTIDTTEYANGPLPLTLSASDAANPANVSSRSQTLHVDNAPVGLSLSGPTNASSAAGTQYVIASATAGPSGVAIACSSDGGPYRWHYGAGEQIPVSGVGTHQLECFAQNGAIDPSGTPARSATETFTMKIGAPTVMVIAFTRIVDKLRCHEVPERVKVPAHWVTIHRHQRHVTVHKRAGYEVVKVMRCHEHTAVERIAVWKMVVRDGKKVQVKRYKTISVAVPPHLVDYTTQWVPHGHGTTVHGWLGTPTGAALGGQAVEVLTAADNGLGRFRVAAIATTGADGSWSARVAPGPSRLIEAVYPGGPTTEGASRDRST